MFDLSGQVQKFRLGWRQAWPVFAMTQSASSTDANLSKQPDNHAKQRYRIESMGPGARLEQHLLAW